MELIYEFMTAFYLHVVIHVTMISCLSTAEMENGVKE
jgi:hypothetical protein